MLTFSEIDEGIPIGKIHINNNKKKKYQILEYVDEFGISDKKIKSFKEYKTNNKIIPVPDAYKRFCEYIAGASGSGKSYLASMLIDEYYNLYPDKDIYIFSRGDMADDPAFDDIDYIQIPIDNDLLDNPIDIVKIAQDSGKGCVFLFDDCGTISDKVLHTEVHRIICDILEVGRKYDVNIIVTNHLVNPNEKTFGRTIMNELTVLTIYPKCGSVKQIRYCLSNYWGLDKKQIDTILKLNSRWVRISKSYPQYVLYEHGAYIL